MVTYITRLESVERNAGVVGRNGRGVEGSTNNERLQVEHASLSSRIKFSLKTASSALVWSRLYSQFIPPKTIKCYFVLSFSVPRSKTQQPCSQALSLYPSRLSHVLSWGPAIQSEFNASFQYTNSSSLYTEPRIGDKTVNVQ